MEGDFQVGTWLIQPKLNSISGNGKTARVEPKAMQVLVYLAEHAGDVMPKERIIQAVWADTFVTDDVLTRAISELRKVFDDDPHEPRFIQTIPKSGYRLIAPVESVGAGLRVRPQEGATRGAPPRRRRVLALGALILVLLLGVGFYVTRQCLAYPEKARAGKIMLVVLPFENLSGDPEQEYFSDGMTEEMTAQLARLDPERLGVIGRATAMTYKRAKKTIDQIGTELHVQYVLEGSVRRAGERVRITAQLVEVADQTHVWAQTYERDLRDVLALQADVAGAIAREVQLKVTPQPCTSDCLTRLWPRCKKGHGSWGLQRGSLWGYVLAAGGCREEAVRMLRRYLELRKPPTPCDVATFYAGSGDKDKPSAWLERAFDEHEPRLVVLKVDPFFDPLRSAPRFQSLLRRMKFPE